MKSVSQYIVRESKFHWVNLQVTLGLILFGWVLSDAAPALPGAFMLMN